MLFRSAEELSKKYTLLELDTLITKEHGETTAYCVLPMESIALEMPTLEQNRAQHALLIQAIKNDEPTLARDMCQALTGRFGGAMDTFYEEILKRIDATGSTILKNPISQ